MKKLFLLLLLAPLFSFSQEIVGVWSKNPQSGQALQFNSDGTFELADLKRNRKVATNMVITYKLISRDNETFIEFSYHSKSNNTVIKKEEQKYKLINDELYLSKTKEENGVETIQEYADVYTRIK